MDLPEPDRRILAPAPVERVVCQLRFDTNPEVSRSSLGRRWAEALGELFPRFDQVQSDVLTIRGGPNQPAPAVSQDRERGWRFADEDQETVVTLLAGSLALETTAYGSWQAFSDRFSTVLDLLDKEVAPAVEQRLGLRYINRLAAGHAVRDQVEASVLGLRDHELLGAGVRRSDQRALVDLGNQLRANVRFKADETDNGPILDIDVYREMGRPFDAARTRSVLDDLNTHALSIFQACVRDEYLSSLRSGGTG